MSAAPLRIGCAAGFWGDSREATKQLLNEPLDVLVFDYLAEVTMSILAKARSRDPEAGYAKDFVQPVMAENLKRIAERNVKVVANAGGINPRACRDALAAVAAEQGIDLRIAVVEGDDVSGQIDSLRRQGVTALDDGRPLPEDVWSANAYLGARPIAAALEAGAQVVITGRCVDSALVLGPLIHAFGWGADDYDRLAAGSLAGHVVECGCQATGGIFTDWESVPGWDNVGFPIVECEADGRFTVTKPKGTGGLVTPPVVAEQILYEVHDPAAYLLPDVTCDFTRVRLEAAGENRVTVSGARGGPPPASYKVAATHGDGYRSTAMFTLVGIDAPRKAERVAESILSRTRALFAERNLGDYRRTSLKLIGTEEVFGPHARAEAMATREVVLRLDVHHDRRDALQTFASEIAPSGTAMSPGRCSLVGGRPGVTPVVRLFSCLIPKGEVEAAFLLDGQRHIVEEPPRSKPAPAATPAPDGLEVPPASMDGDGGERIALVEIAHGRSGDKGNAVNIGVIARRPEYLPHLKSVLTEEAVAAWFAHLAKGPVARYDVPGLSALNFVLQEALDGGGTASLRNDPLGKGFAQILLTMPVPPPPGFRTASP